MLPRIAPCLLFLIAASGQTFEVASVKIAPVPPGDLYNINLGTLQHDTLTFGNAALADCIRYAYGLTSNMQLSGPAWITNKTDRYDIVAKIAPGATAEQVGAMLQSLLTERFKLVLHRETRELSYYTLVVGKGGSKMKVGSDAPPEAAPNLPGQLHIINTHLEMARLCDLLSRYMRAFVVDRTGLAGRFDVRLFWTPDDRPVADDERGPSVFTAVQEQLGLKLESRKGPMEVLVIDSVEKNPVEN